MIMITSHLESSGSGCTHYFAKSTKAISRRTLDGALLKPRDELRALCASPTAAAAGNTRAQQQQYPHSDIYHYERVVRDGPRGTEKSPRPRYPGIAPRITHQSREMQEHMQAVQGTAGGKVVYENGVGKWTRCEVLGQGAHGVVYRGVAEDTLESIAVKQIQTSAMGRSKLQAAENEIRMLPRLRHPNVVRFLGVEEVDDRLNIFLEYLDKGSVRNRLERDGRMSEDETAVITRKILAGLAYLHSRGITHRDIKGANVLLSRDGAVKLADFGTSKLVGQESVTSGLKGTPHWMAPEVIRNQQQGHEGWTRADVWSVGCTAIEMLTGKMPWPDIPNAVAAMFKIARGSTPPIDRDLSPDASSFIRACCCPKPSQRYTVEQLMNHPFLWRPRYPGAEALHPAHGQPPAIGDLARDPCHFFDASWPSDDPREQQPFGGPSAMSSRPRVRQPLNSDGVLDESELQLLLRGVSSGGDERQRPPCRSRETVAKLRGKPKKNSRADLPLERSPRASVVTATGAALGATMDGSEASRTRKTGTVSGPPPKPLLLPLPQQLSRMHEMLERDALSQSAVRTRHSTPPTRSLQHCRSPGQKYYNGDASLFTVSAAQGAPSPYSSLSGVGGGDISSLGSRVTAQQQRLVESTMLEKEEEEEELVGEHAPYVCRSDSSCRREVIEGLEMNSSRVCRKSQGSDQRWFTDKQQLQQNFLSVLSRSLTKVPSARTVDRARRAERGGLGGHDREGVGSSSSTTTSSGLQRQTSIFAGLRDEDSRNSASAPITRRGTSYATTPRAVRAAAREDLEGSEVARAGCARPESPIAGEYINMGGHRGASRLAPGGYPRGNPINAGRNIPACSGPPRCGRSRSTPLQQQAVMRTRSAGAIATAVKLPPLGKTAGKNGEDRFRGVGGGGEGVLAGLRLITSAPTMVGSSPALSSKARADAAARVAGGVAGLTPGKHAPVEFLYGEQFVSAAVGCPLEHPAERRFCAGNRSEGRSSLAASNSGGDRADSTSAFPGNGDGKDCCQRGRPLLLRRTASFARVRANAISPLRAPVAVTLSPESAKGGPLRPQAERKSRSSAGSSGGGDFPSILSLHSPHLFDAEDSGRAPFARNRVVPNACLRRESLGDEINGYTTAATGGRDASSAICSGMSVRAARAAGGTATGAVSTASSTVGQGF